MLENSTRSISKQNRHGKTLQLTKNTNYLCCFLAFPLRPEESFLEVPLLDALEMGSRDGVGMRPASIWQARTWTHSTPEYPCLQLQKKVGAPFSSEDSSTKASFSVSSTNSSNSLQVVFILFRLNHMVKVRSYHRSVPEKHKFRPKLH